MNGTLQVSVRTSSALMVTFSEVILWRWIAWRRRRRKTHWKMRGDGYGNMHLTIKLHFWIWVVVRIYQNAVNILWRATSFPGPSVFLTICLAFFHIPLLSSLHLSVICSDGPPWQRGWGVCVMGKAFGIVFHWRGECITPHGEENTGAFLLAEASKDQAQNPVFPKLKICTVHLA